MLGDRLQAHVVRRGQLADRGVAGGEPGDHVAPGRVGEGREDLGESVVHVSPLSRSTCWLNNHRVGEQAVVNREVENL